MTDTYPDFHHVTPEGEDRERRVCRTCGFIDYVNPKIVAGVVAISDDGRVLMCRRAIEPRSGFWTLPAGYMEQGESVEEAALREAREEACATLELEGVLAIYSIPRLSQVQIFFRARMSDPHFAAGPESREVALYDWDALPLPDLAFPSVKWALDDYRAGHGRDLGPAMRTQGPDFKPL
ncbi:NUDIX domain-containing protein [Oceanicaulis sp. LC35]|uniref:NUDIX hydrolase n=1 Tax=Oceanicaulis sp. LC35 TaxID=3349635 RepID=UPI003F87FBDB